jgi:hypothetical protein
MAKVIIKNNFGVVPNDLLNDKELTFKAKGVYAYIQSKPANWDFSAERISMQTKEGVTSVRMALIELEDAGYLIRTQSRNNRGYLVYSYQLSSCPIGDCEEIPTSDNPRLENPRLDNPRLDNLTLYSKKENSNKEISKIEDRFDQFWEVYGKKVGKENTRKQWAKLKESEKDEILVSVTYYTRARPDAMYRKDPERYLKNRVWEDEVIINPLDEKRKETGGAPADEESFVFNIPDKW